MLSYLQTKQTLKFSHCRQMLAPLEVSKPKQDSKKHQVTSAQRVKNMFMNSNYLGEKRKKVGKFEKTSVMTEPYFSRVNLLSCDNTLKKKLEYSCFTVLLVSALQVSESAVCIHISPPSQPALSSLPTPGHHRARSQAPCTIWQVPAGCMAVHTSVPASPFIPPSLPSALYICVSLPACR